MREFPDAWPLPRYSAPPLMHMHAMGVISLNYNQYEHALFSIFLHQFERLKVPGLVTEHIFTQFAMQEKTEAIKKVYSLMEADQQVRDAVEHLLGHFGWCFEARNLLLHAHESQHNKTIADFFKEETLAKISLAKPKKGSTTALNFMHLGLPELRSVADAMYAGYVYLLDLWAYLRKRDGLIPSSFAKELYYLLPAALPHKPQIPKKIKLRDRPVTPEE